MHTKYKRDTYVYVSGKEKIETPEVSAKWQGQPPVVENWAGRFREEQLE